jgi:hypothetical protein
VGLRRSHRQDSTPDPERLRSQGRYRPWCRRPAFDIFKEHIRQYIQVGGDALPSRPRPFAAAKELGGGPDQQYHTIDGNQYPYRPARSPNFPEALGRSSGLHSAWAVR